MNLKKSDELLLLIENNLHTIKSQAKTRAAEAVFLILIKSIDTFDSNLKLILQEEIYLIDVTINESYFSYFLN